MSLLSGCWRHNTLTHTNHLEKKQYLKIDYRAFMLWANTSCDSRTHKHTDKQYLVTFLNGRINWTTLFCVNGSGYNLHTDMALHYDRESSVLVHSTIRLWVPPRMPVPLFWTLKLSVLDLYTKSFNKAHKLLSV